MAESAGLSATQPGLEPRTAERRSVRDQALAEAISATPSIQFMLDRHAAERPEAVALACSSMEGGWTRASWRSFAQGTRRVAAGLLGLGICRGDHVAILLDNRSAYECFTAYIAALRAGGVVVPLNPRSAVEELAYGLKAAECRWLIAGADTAECVRAASAKVDGLRGTVGVGGAPEGWHAWRSVAESPAELGADVAVTPDATSSILFTSGTTARPKGAVHTHGSAVATGGIVATGLALDSTDVIHHAVRSSPAPVAISA